MRGVKCSLGVLGTVSDRSRAREGLADRAQVLNSVVELQDAVVDVALVCRARLQVQVHRRDDRNYVQDTLSSTLQYSTIR